MEKITTVLDFTAVVIQILGAYIMFINSPENKPNFVSTVGFGEGDSLTFKNKNKALKNGFKILGVGFGIQLISMTLKQFC